MIREMGLIQPAIHECRDDRRPLVRMIREMGLIQPAIHECRDDDLADEVVERRRDPTRLAVVTIGTYTGSTWVGANHHGQQVGRSGPLANLSKALT